MCNQKIVYQIEIWKSTSSVVANGTAYNIEFVGIALDLDQICNDNLIEIAKTENCHRARTKWMGSRETIIYTCSVNMI